MMGALFGKLPNKRMSLSMVYTLIPEKWLLVPLGNWILITSDG